LKDRDTCVKPGYNSRLDSIQAIVGMHELKKLDWVTGRRIENAKRYDEGLKDVPQITIPSRNPDVKQVYHLYVIQAERRDELMAFLAEKEVETKIHYPIPLHLQPGLKQLGYKKRDFPVCERQAEHILSLPIHEYLTEEQIDFVIETIRHFHGLS